MNRRATARPSIIGRYAIFDAIAVGGMATVHFGRLVGPAGFSRTVVIKRLHAHYAAQPELAAMFLDEARVAARIRHPNVVGIIDMVAQDDDVFLVMEYVHGESLANLVRADGRREARRFARIGNIVAGALSGLHAAHEAIGENQKPLGVVHRDVSPQNILVGVDGTARVLDFGVAKAAGQRHHSNDGEVRGKVRYLSPEQVRCAKVDRRTDLWSASIVLWEALTGRRLFDGADIATVLANVLDQPIPAPHEVVPEIPAALSRVVMRGLERDPAKRFATAREMAAALEDAVGLIPPREIGAWVERVGRARLDARRRVLDAIEGEDLAELVPVDPRTQAFAATSDAAMVRVLPPPSPRRRRAAMVAWGACAGLVVLIAGGVGARLLPGGGPAAGVTLGADVKAVTIDAEAPPVVLGARADHPAPASSPMSSATSRPPAPRHPRPPAPTPPGR